MIPLIPMAIGAGIGALTNRKKPLQGALLGAGGGAAGGLLSGAGAAAEGVAGGAAGGTGLTMGGSGMGLSAGGTGMGLSGSLPLSSSLSTAANGTAAQVAGSSGGLLAQARPYMDAAGMGIQAAGMFQQPQQPITPSPTMQNGGGANQLQALSQSLEQQKLTDAQMQQLKREAQQKLIGQIGGRYGLIG